MSEQAIEIADYDPGWPEAFVQERLLLESLLAPWIVGGCEHVGSTAVPGLSAKPVIDVMVGVAGLEESRLAIPVLEAHGYCYSPYRPDLMHWFCKPSPARRTHHVHLVPFASPLWHDRLLFRDYLRARAPTAKEYARLKRELASRHRTDREAYTEAKTEFVKHVLTMARSTYSAAMSHGIED